MFTFTSSLFWYKLIFLAELLCAEALAIYTLKKKPHFVKRVLISIGALLLVTILLPVFFVNPLVNTINTSLIFLTIFTASIVCLKFCFEEKFVTLFFTGIVAYTTQHIAYTTFTLFVELSGITNFHIYGETLTNLNNPFIILFYFAVYGTIYWFVWAFIEYKLREKDSLVVEPILLGSFTGILFIEIVLNALVVYYLSDILPPIGKMILYVYRLSSMVFTYIVLYAVLDKHASQHEVEIIERLWLQDRNNYKAYKQNISDVTIMCHDLKHQIRELKRDPSKTIDDEYLANLENLNDID